MVSDFWFVGVMDPAWYVDEWVGCVKHAYGWYVEMCTYFS